MVWPIMDARELWACYVPYAAKSKCDRKELESGLDARARIEVVAQGVADEVKTQHGQHHRKRGKENEMRRVEQVRAAVVEHGSPARGRRRDAESKKTHGGFREDGSGHADGGLHDHRLNNIRQNVAGNNS